MSGVRKREVDRVERVSFSNIQSLLKSEGRRPPSRRRPAQRRGRPRCRTARVDRAGAGSPGHDPRPPRHHPTRCRPRRRSALIDRAGADSPGHALRRSPRRPQPAQCHPRERGISARLAARNRRRGVLGQRGERLRVGPQVRDNPLEVVLQEGRAGYQRAPCREEPTPWRSGPTRRAPPRRPAGPRQPARGSPPGGPGPSSHRTCMVARASRVVRTRSTASDDAQSSHDRRAHLTGSSTSTLKTQT